MKYNKNDYVNKEIKLYPSDSYYKYGIIKNVDDLGFTILITKAQDHYTNYKVGEMIFISHSSNFNFIFI